jgi:hypothetical protein
MMTVVVTMVMAMAAVAGGAIVPASESQQVGAWPGACGVWCVVVVCGGGGGGVWWWWWW